MGESTVVKGKGDTSLPAKITLRCRVLRSGEEVYSYATKVVKVPGSLWRSAASMVRSQAEDMTRAASKPGMRWLLRTARGMDAPSKTGLTGFDLAMISGASGCLCRGSSGSFSAPRAPRYTPWSVTA